MNENFEAFLEALRDEELPIPIDDFESVSDLDSTPLMQFMETWDALSLERRRLLIALLGQQADEKFELDFDLINQALLDDPDPDVRRIAISNLWESEDPALIPAFSVALQDSAHLSVQIAAAEALGRFILLGQLGKLPDGALASIEGQLLESLTHDPEVSLRGTLIESLGYSSREEVSEAIEAAYKSELDSLQASAVIAMGRSYHERWTDTIMEELSNPSPEIRAEAARAAGELEIRSARLTLIELLDDVHDLVQKNAVWALGQIGGEAALEALNRLLTNTHAEDVLYQAIEESLDHIAFLQGTPDFLLFDLDEEDT